MVTSEHRRDAIIAVIRASAPASVFGFELAAPLVTPIDLSVTNPIMTAADLRDNNALTLIVSQAIEQSGARIGIGGYNEKRGWYARGAQFSQGEEVRSIHIGVDIWAPVATPVFAPYDAVVHSAQDNALYGDYGPTVILEHTLEGVSFYTLYGHLSRESLNGKTPGACIAQGGQVGTLGAPPINGDWPPHLHFQVITDMLGKVGDFPGVAAESQREYWLALCPDPNEILRCGLLSR